MAFATARSRREDLARATDAETVGAELMELGTHKDGAVRAAVAARPDCPLATALNLAMDRDSSVVDALLSNPMAPRVVIQAIADMQGGKARKRANAMLTQSAA